eukprot:COSAG02_NODE_4562_length_5215_cov_2.705043_3_plen_157_part_00
MRRWIRGCKAEPKAASVHTLQTPMNPFAFVTVLQCCRHVQSVATQRSASLKPRCNHQPTVKMSTLATSDASQLKTAPTFTTPSRHKIVQHGTITKNQLPGEETYVHSSLRRQHSVQQYHRRSSSTTWLRRHAQVAAFRTPQTERRQTRKLGQAQCH